MHRPRKHIFYFLILIISLSNSDLSFAQSYHSKAEVKDMFPSNTKNLWINFLSGTLDGEHTIDMIIGTDGHTCKGIYTMRNSKVSNYFEGNEHNKQLQLIEQDADGRHTGYLLGKYDGQHFEGMWMPKDKKRAIPFALHFVNAYSDYQPTLCRDKYWEQYFSGKVDDKPTRMNIKRQAEIFTYQIWQNDLLTTDAIIKHEIERVYNLPVNDPKSSLNGMTIVIDTLDMTKITLSRLDDGNYENTQSLKADRRMTYDCFNYADNICRMECRKPVLGHKKFDTWIEDRCREWIQKNTKELSSQKNQKLGLADRWSQSAESWVEVSLFLDDLISGTIYFQSSWHNGTDMVSFIYNLNEGREIQIKDVFASGFNAIELLSESVAKYHQSVILPPDKKKWAFEQLFPHTILSQEGIVLKSPFSTIFGELEIVIPYMQVAENIKNKSIIKDILLK